MHQKLLEIEIWQKNIQRHKLSTWQKIKKNEKNMYRMLRMMFFMYLIFVGFLYNVGTKISKINEF